MNTIKPYYHIKQNVSTKEYRIYKHLHNLGLPFVPKLYNYDKNKLILKTQKINGSTIADLYGENFRNSPKEIIEEIREIVKCLYYIGIIYPDITGYNFIQDNQSRIWIVDFEHCFSINPNTNVNALTPDENDHINFVIKFCFKNKQSWNPYFA